MTFLAVCCDILLQAEDVVSEIKMKIYILIFLFKEPKIELHSHLLPIWSLIGADCTRRAGSRAAVHIIPLLSGLYATLTYGLNKCAN